MPPDSFIEECLDEVAEHLDEAQDEPRHENRERVGRALAAIEYLFKAVQAIAESSSTERISNLERRTYHLGEMISDGAETRQALVGLLEELDGRVGQLRSDLEATDSYDFEEQLQRAEEIAHERFEELGSRLDRFYNQLFDQAEIADERYQELESRINELKESMRQIRDECSGLDDIPEDRLNDEAAQDLEFYRRIKDDIWEILDIVGDNPEIVGVEGGELILPAVATHLEGLSEQDEKCERLREALRMDKSMDEMRPLVVTDWPPIYTWANELARGVRRYLDDGSATRAEIENSIDQVEHAVRRWKEALDAQTKGLPDPDSNDQESTLTRFEFVGPKLFVERNKETNKVIRCWELTEPWALETATVCSKSGAEPIKPSEVQGYPSPGEVSQLPDHVRKYIHDLETRCDPAGDLRRLDAEKQKRRELRAETEELREAIRDMAYRVRRLARRGMETMSDQNAVLECYDDVAKFADEYSFPVGPDRKPEPGGPHDPIEAGSGWEDDQGPNFVVREIWIDEDGTAQIKIEEKTGDTLTVALSDLERRIHKNQTRRVD